MSACEQSTSWMPTATGRVYLDYATATPDTLQRRFLSTGGLILNHGQQIVVRLDRRTYSPVLRQADLPTLEVPWWDNRQLRYEFQ
jgi:hypothetical protein